MTMILEAVEILVPLAADFAAIGLLFLHADGARIWNRCGRVDDGKGAVRVLFELLILVAVLRVC